MQDLTIIAERLLGRKITKSDGIPISELNEAELKLKHKLPKSLKDLYQILGNNVLLLDSFNHFALPSQLQEIDGKVIFLEENQGVAYWGFEINDANPWVYQTPYEYEWHPENLQLKEFLSVIMYYQCAHGYEFGGISEISENELQSRLNTEWEKTVHHNGLQIYWKPDCLLWFIHDENNKIIDDIYFSARTEEAYNKHIEKYNLTEAD